MPRLSRSTAAAAVLALQLRAAAAQTFQPCDFSAAGAASQVWVVAGSGIALQSSPKRCLSLSSGCCFGEDVRGGDLVGMDGCNAGDVRQMFAWPSPDFAPAPNTIYSTASAGADVSPSVNGAPLVIDGRGSAVPGEAAQLRAYRDQITSAMLVNGTSTAGARLVHAATGLCLDSGGARAQLGPRLSLAACDAKKQVQGSWLFGSQLFDVPSQGGAAGALRDQRGQCVSAAHALGAFNSVAGEVRLVGASCGPAATPSQTFSFLANGSISAPLFAPAGLVLDAAGGTWLGAPVSLLPASSAASSVFTFAVAQGSTTTGTLTHKATGLCLDTSAIPWGHGCLHPSVRGLPFCDAAAPLASRVADLVSRLSLQEAAEFTGAGEYEEPCVTMMPSIARLDVPEVRQLVEVTSMASGSCVPNGGNCSTAFASGLLLGGSFNKSVWLNHGIIVGREMRAISNVALNDNNPNGNFNTLSGHGPDINQPRDPRNGRIGELISEDGFLTGHAAESVVKGMQFGADVEPAAFAGPLVMLASLKHYNAYSMESNRFGSRGNISLFDLWDSYLPQYERPMTHAAAAGTMCSYFSMRIEGSPGEVYVPSCSDPYLLTDVIRTYWNRPDATHLTDCGAVWSQAQPESSGGNGYVANLTLAAAASINAGCDMNSNTITPTQLGLALQLGLVAEQTVRATAARVLAQRFRVGQFDPLDAPGNAPLLALGAADIGTAASRAVAADGIAQSLVLVRNTHAALPLTPGKRIALLGPTGNSFDALRGDCYCSGYCSEGSACFPSLESAITDANAGGTVATFSGVSMKGNDSSWGAAIAAVAAADAVVLALGTDTSVAQEGGDRGDGIGLPGLQGAFGVAVLRAAAAANVPVVLLLLHNLPVSFDELVAPAGAGFKPVDAIVDAWAPMTYANEVAAALFGKTNRWGKATMTIYPKAYADTIALSEYSMTKPPGRSYKYYDNSAGVPLIGFGEGKSYSTFDVACRGALAPGEPTVHISCNISNVFGPDGDEVLLVFHRPSAATVARVAGAHPLPLRALVGFERVSVAAGAAAPVNFEISVAEALAFVNEDGASVLYPGLHFLDVSNGNGANVTIPVVLEAPRAVTVKSPPRPRHAVG